MNRHRRVGKVLFDLLMILSGGWSVRRRDETAHGEPAAGGTPVAEEHLHWGPGEDSIEHVMSAFCPCGPELVVEHTEPDFVGDETFPVITYHHQRVGE